MDALTLLIQRNSAPKLRAPAPQGEALERMFRAALRAPDHARLRPWRFLTIEGEARVKLGELYAEAGKMRNPAITAEEMDRFRAHPLRAPLVITVVASISEHPKVPRDEQLLSAGCAAHALLLAAEAEGYGGIWRTGAHALDRHVAKGLGLAENEEIVGFLYLGTRAGEAKPLPELELSDFVSHWS